MKRACLNKFYKRIINYNIRIGNIPTKTIQSCKAPQMIHQRISRWFSDKF